MPVLAGIPVTDDDVVELIRLLRVADFPTVADKLEHLNEGGVSIFALTIVDRETILWALDEPPTDGLAELRAVLRKEHGWRVREGLV